MSFFGRAVGFAAMGVAFHNENHGSAFDDSVDTWLRAHGQALWKTLIHITDPGYVLVFYVVLIGWAAYRRRWPVVAWKHDLAGD